MKGLTLTHILLFFVLAALVMNLAVMLQSPARAAADDFSDVVRQLDEMNGTLEDLTTELDGINAGIGEIADAELFDLRASSATGASSGLPVVVVGN